MTKLSKILIVDDDPFEVDLLEQQLEELGYETASAANGQEALAKVVAMESGSGFPGILIVDIRMPQMDGLELMKHIQSIDPDLPVILITAYGDIAMAVQAMQDGAYDFIEKPVNPERLKDVVQRAAEKRSLILDNRILRAKLADESGMEGKIIGDSHQIRSLRESITKLSDTDASVLIFGETGSGKELVAKCLHEHSSRKKYNFVPINCGAIPENLFEDELFGHEKDAFTTANQRRIGKLEYAHRGTVFLDEIESMPLNLQVKLLRSLEEREIERLGSNKPIQIDIRVVAATKVDLEEAIKKGDFRDDLYFRLNVAKIHIPPLRDRREDIPILYDFFANQLALKYEREIPQISRDDFQELMAYAWPGNVRELKNKAERLVLGLNTHERSSSNAVNSPSKDALTLYNQVDAFEKRIIDKALSDNHGSIQSTMAALGIARRTLNDKMRKYGLNRKDYI